MATIAGEAAATPIPAQPAGTLAQVIDRWIYVFTAALFLTTALVGFIPDALNKIAAVEAGLRPPFPAILHVHAVLMGAWLLLLLTQATLQATGRKPLHWKLGATGFVLAPTIVVVGLMLVPTMRGQVWEALQAAPPGPQREALEASLARSTNVLLVQLRIAIVYPAMIALALLSRRRDPGLHKRLLFLGTVSLMGAAITRITFLPTTYPATYVSTELYILLLVTPMFAWDLYRQRTVHRAYLIWLGALFLPTIAVHLLWGTEWWQTIGPGLMGLPSLA